MYEEAVLRNRSGGYTKSRMVRRYHVTPNGRAKQQAEADAFAKHGYAAQSAVLLPGAGGQGGDLFAVAYVRFDSHRSWPPLTGPPVDFVAPQVSEWRPKETSPERRSDVPRAATSSIDPPDDSVPEAPVAEPRRQPESGSFGELAKMLVVYSLLGIGGLFVFNGFTHNMEATFFVAGALFLVPAVAFLFAWFPQGLPAWDERGLAGATDRWQAAVVMRHYKNDNGGRSKAASEAGILARHGYLPSSQSATGSHINVGRTVTPAVLTGGISLLFGASRTKGDIDITFVRQ